MFSMLRTQFVLTILCVFLQDVGFCCADDVYRGTKCSTFLAEVKKRVLYSWVVNIHCDSLLAVTV